MEHHTKLSHIIQHAFAQNKQKIDPRRINLMAWLIIALCTCHSINYKKLAQHIGRRADTDSNYRSIQRFMEQANLPIAIIATIIYQSIGIKGKVVLIMDRTNWQFGKHNINILMLAIRHNNIAYPLMFKLLDKKGNSNTTERKELLDQYITLFGKDNIAYLLADREFIGHDWLKYLDKHRIHYIIRVRHNFLIGRTRRRCVSKLLVSLKHGDIYYTDRRHYILSNHCYITALHRLDKDGKPDDVILISNLKTHNALQYYQDRWQIECLFKGLKSSGFNFEDTHVTHLDRLERLLSVTMLAFVWCYKLGEFVHQHLKPIKIKTHGRRAVSMFVYGLRFIARCLQTGYKPNFLKNVDFTGFLLSCT